MISLLEEEYSVKQSAYVLHLTMDPTDSVDDLPTENKPFDGENFSIPFNYGVPADGSTAVNEISGDVYVYSDGAWAEPGTGGGSGKMLVSGCGLDVTKDPSDPYPGIEYKIYINGEEFRTRTDPDGEGDDYGSFSGCAVATTDWSTEKIDDVGYGGGFIGGEYSPIEVDYGSEIKIKILRYPVDPMPDGGYYFAENAGIVFLIEDSYIPDYGDDPQGRLIWWGINMFEDGEIEDDEYILPDWVVNHAKILYIYPVFLSNNELP